MELLLSQPPPEVVAVGHASEGGGDGNPSAGSIDVFAFIERNRLHSHVREKVYPF